MKPRDGIHLSLRISHLYLGYRDWWVRECDSKDNSPLPRDESMMSREYHLVLGTHNATPGSLHGTPELVCSTAMRQ